MTSNLLELIEQHLRHRRLQGTLKGSLKDARDLLLGFVAELRVVPQQLVWAYEVFVDGDMRETHSATVNDQLVVQIIRRTGGAFWMLQEHYPSGQALPPVDSNWEVLQHAAEVRWNQYVQSIARIDG